MMRKISFIMLFVMIASAVFADNFVLKHDSKSIATGITICFKNKKYLEKKFNLPGASDFAAHLFKVKAKKFEDEFKLIGAEVQFYDYPFIPFDDYYTNDYFGFVRIKVLPENTHKALFLAAKLIDEVLNFNARDFLIATKSTFGSNVMRNKAKEKAKSEIWKMYFPDSFVSLPDYMFAPKLSEKRFREFLKAYLENSNIFISLYGKFDEKAVKEVIKDHFSSKKQSVVHNSLPVARLKVHKKTIEMKSKQALVYVVFPVKDGISIQDYARLRVLTANASDKIAFQIREKEGLAYFIGCSIVYKGGHSFFVGYCGTNPEKADYVAEKMESLIKNYMLNPVELKQRDLEKIRNSIVFSNILKTLPNVNKSFFNALFELTGHFAYNKNLLDKALKKGKISRLCGREYLDTNNYLNIILK